MPHDDSNHNPSGSPQRQNQDQDRLRRSAARPAPAAPRHEDADDDGFDESDPLWDMLGKAPMAPADPWLAARTMARLRRENEQVAPLWQRILRAPAFVFGALALALIVGLVTGMVLNPSAQQPASLVNNSQQPQTPAVAVVPVQPAQTPSVDAGSGSAVNATAMANTEPSLPAAALPADMDEALTYLVASDNLGGMELDIWGDSSDL